MLVEAIYTSGYLKLLVIAIGLLFCPSFGVCAFLDFVMISENLFSPLLLCVPSIQISDIWKLSYL